MVIAGATAVVATAATAFAGYLDFFFYSDFYHFYYHHLGDLIAPGYHRVPRVTPRKAQVAHFETTHKGPIDSRRHR